MYLVFLDFDGVLATERTYLSFSYTHDYECWSRFDPVAIDFFNRLDDTYRNVEFVWTTTWRDKLNASCEWTSHLAQSLFRTAGFRGRFASPWKVNPDDDPVLSKAGRGHEVLDFLTNHYPHCRDFIIFDDNEHDFTRVLGVKRLVRTSADDGMLTKHMRNALSLAGTWERRRKE